ncbi:MAG: hypothetical protein HQL42_13265 [Alphaproteobacteria bacterium]|nr:hypothetical protein [Alphaproteobacteria bacterium]
MAEHEPSIGGSDDWYTPPDISEALGLIFDLDPCSPGPGHWVPALRIYTKGDDGLAQPWEGLVWMNPPFGGRFGHVPWLQGVAVRAQWVEGKRQSAPHALSFQYGAATPGGSERMDAGNVAEPHGGSTVHRTANLLGSHSDIK